MTSAGRDARARRDAAALIRCMDSRDQAGAEALAARLYRNGDSGRHAEAVLAWVWRIEAQRAAQSRVYRASPAWRLQRAPAGALRLAGEADALLASLVAVLGGEARAAGWLREPADPWRKPCGTYAAWCRHVDHGELADEACEQAAREYWRDRKRSQRETARKAAA